MAYRITVYGTDITFEAQENETLLLAARRAGLRTSGICETGGCGACRGFLLQGNIKRLPYEPRALKPADAAIGVFLTCRTVALSDLRGEMGVRRPKR